MGPHLHEPLKSWEFLARLDNLWQSYAVHLNTGAMSVRALRAYDVCESIESL